MQQYLKKLLQYRKGSEALQKGKTLHFAPEGGIYLLSRTHGDETAVLLLNKNEGPVKVSLARFRELGLDGRRLRNILTEEKVLWSDTLTLEGPGAYIYTTM